jgi:hypothetical protein
MSRTYLQLIQQAADELGIPQPSQIIGAVDDQSRQLLALSNREGKDFAGLANSRGGWQNLHKEYSFETEVNAATTGDVTLNSKVITNIGDTTGVVAGTWFVDGEGLPYKSVVVSVDSPTQVTIDRPVTEAGTGIALTFAKGGYDMPSDFEYFAQLTYWDGSYRWQLLGPISAQEKQVLKYGISPVGPRRRFYIRDNKFFIDPIPATAYEVLAYDYYSNAYCESAAGVAQSIWTADTDVYRLDEDCFIQGIKWRFLRSKGLDYMEEKASYESDCIRVLARDGGNRDLPLNARNQNLRLLNDSNIPDTNFGQ